MTTRISHWIDGRAPARAPPAAPRPSTTRPPGRRPREVDLACAEEVDAAVASGRGGGQGVALRPRCRAASAVLFAFRELLHARTDELAAIITAEHGKVLVRRRRRDRPRPGERRVRHRRAAAAQGRLLRAGRHRRRRLLIRQPLGVVAGITPFNFPAMVPLWMCANAIACGNAFVLKPSEKDPSAALFLAQLWKDAGLPDGVFTVVHGDKEAVDALLDHPDIAAVSFVGSTPIAKYIYETRHGATASASRPSAARRTTRWCCPTPTSTWPPTRWSPRRTARPASGAWRSRSRSRSATSATAWSTPSPPGCPSCASATAPTRTPTWARSSPPSTATRSPATSTPAPRPGATVVVDGRDGRRARPTASSSARRCSTTSRPR